MTEAEIAASLRQTIPAPSPQAEPVQAGIMTDEQSSTVSGELNGYAILKISGQLGIDPTTMDTDTENRLKYIYEEIARQYGKTDLVSVQEYLQDALIRQGFAYRPDRFMRLWLHMRLNNEKQAVETEMERLRG